MPLGQRANSKLILIPTVDLAIGAYLLASNGTPIPERQTVCHYKLGIGFTLHEVKPELLFLQDQGPDLSHVSL